MGFPRARYLKCLCFFGGVVCEDDERDAAFGIILTMDLKVHGSLLPDTYPNSALVGVDTYHVIRIFTVLVHAESPAVFPHAGTDTVFSRRESRYLRGMTRKSSAVPEELGAGVIPELGDGAKTALDDGGFTTGDELVGAVGLVGATTSVDLTGCKKPYRSPSHTNMSTAIRREPAVNSHLSTGTPPANRFGGRFGWDSCKESRSKMT